jgi:putative flippase GtrA
MNTMTMGRASQQSARPVAAAALDAPPVASPKRAVWRIPSWRHVLSGKPAESALVEFLRYGITSAVALACDFAILVLFTELAGIHYLISAATGFGAGIFIAYALSVRWVFSHRRFANASAERLLFILIGVAGMALNQVIMFGLTGLLMPYAFSKLASIGVVFTVNFTLRKVLLFTGAARTGD